MSTKQAVDSSTRRQRLSALRASQVWTRPHGDDSVPLKRAKGVYQLGLDRNPVTVYTQQIRALRLADALASVVREKHERNVEVAVIGAGIAGMTFAAAFTSLTEDLASLRIFDAGEEPFGPLRGSSRIIHPMLYNWPDPSWNRSTANLPYYPWKFDSAAKVVDDWDKAWSRIGRLRGLAVEEERVSKLVSAPEGADGTVQRWRLDNRPDRYAYVVCCSGFGSTIPAGVERSPGCGSVVGEETYWGDWEGAINPARHTNVTFIGSGDSAVSDALELIFGPDYLYSVVDTLSAVDTSQMLSFAQGLGIADESGYKSGPIHEQLVGLLSGLTQTELSESLDVALAVSKSDGFKTASSLSRFLVYAADRLNVLKMVYVNERVKSDLSNLTDGTRKAGSDCVFFWRTANERLTLDVEFDGVLGPVRVEKQDHQGHRGDIESLRQFPRIEDYCLSLV